MLCNIGTIAFYLLFPADEHIQDFLRADSCKKIADKVICGNTEKRAVCLIK